MPVTKKVGENVFAGTIIKNGNITIEAEKVGDERTVSRIIKLVEDANFNKPSDCVHVALTGLLDEKPDLVVSGINCGANMGDDTMYSGTVAAAIEGYLFGVPSIAFSQIDKGWAELESAAKVASAVVERFIERRDAEIEAGKTADEPVLLNVNIPNMPFESLRGILGTRLGRRSSAEPVIAEMSPRGFPIYWLGAAGKPIDAAEGTDFWATSHGYVSVTPLQVDLTSFKQVEPWFSS